MNEIKKLLISTQPSRDEIKYDDRYIVMWLPTMKLRIQPGQFIKCNLNRLRILWGPVPKPYTASNNPHSLIKYHKDLFIDHFNSLYGDELKLNTLNNTEYYVAYSYGYYDGDDAVYPISKAILSIPNDITSVSGLLNEFTEKLKNKLCNGFSNISNIVILNYYKL